MNKIKNKTRKMRVKPEDSKKFFWVMLVFVLIIGIWIGVQGANQGMLTLATSAQGLTDQDGAIKVRIRALDASKVNESLYTIDQTAVVKDGQLKLRWQIPGTAKKKAAYIEVCAFDKRAGPSTSVKKACLEQPGDLSYNKVSCPYYVPANSTGFSGQLNGWNKLDDSQKVGCSESQSFGKVSSIKALASAQSPGIEVDGGGVLVAKNGTIKATNVEDFVKDALAGESYSTVYVTNNVPIPGEKGQDGVSGANGVDGADGAVGIATVSGGGLLLTGSNLSLDDSCIGGQILQWNGTEWVCASVSGTDSQTLSLASNVLAISGGNSVNLSGYLDNTDSQALSWNGGTRTLSLTSGGSVVISDSDTTYSAGNGLSLGGTTFSINSPTCAGTTKLQWNGSAFTCAADVDTDTTNFNVSANSGAAQNISSGGTVNFVNGSGTTASRSGNDITFGIANTTVSAGTYSPSNNANGSLALPQFTVDAQGRLTGASTTNVTLTGIANSQLANSAITVNTAGGLTGGSSVSLGGSINLSLDLSDAGDSATATTSSGSGIEVSGSEIGLLRGCSSSQLLKWNSSTLRWECANDIDTDTNSGGTVTSITAGTGLSGGTITTSGTINIANTGVTAATYGSSTSIPVITVNAQGQITAASSSAIPTATTSTTGLLTDTDWDTFNGKENILTFNGNGLFSRSGNTVTGLACTAGQIPKWTAGTFVCGSDDNSGGTSYSAGNGLSLSVSTFSINSPTCAGTTKLTWNGTAFSCATDVDTDTNTTDFNISANGGAGQNIAAGDTVNFANGTGTTASRSGNDISFGIANTAVSAGTYSPSNNANGSLALPQFTVDAQGRLTAASTTNVTLTGIANSQLANSSITVNTAGGLNGGATVSLGGTLNLGLDLSDAGDSATATTSSGSGLEVSGSEVGLIRGCSSNQLLKWNSSSLRWECAADLDTDTNSGGTVTSITAGTGLSGGTITTSGTINIATTGVTAATYGSSTSIPVITVNAQGQITAASSSAIPTATTSTTGLLTDTDWDTFNGKENVLTFNGNGLFSRSGNTVTGLACSAGQIPKWTAGTFACGADIDTDTDTTYSAGNGLSLGGTTFSINSPTCSGTDKLTWSGTAFSCSSDVDTDTDTTNFNVAAAGTGGSQNISSGGTVTFGNGTGTTATRSGSTVTYGLNNTAVSAGAYSPSDNANGSLALPQFTVDAQGRLTAASTTNVTLTGIANSQLANSAITVNTAGGLSGGTSVSLGGSINLSLDLSDAGDTATASTNSGSGLEVSGGEIGLIRGCSSNQLLKWNSTSLRWECANDTDTDTNSGGTVTSITAGTGLSGGTITTSGTINIASTGVTAASYGSSTSIPVITVNAQGQITAASSTAIPTADTSTAGLLTDTDWDTFNGKENVLTFNGNGLFSRSGNTVTGLACTAGQIPKWTAGSFVCGTDIDIDTDTTYSAGNGLSLGGTTFSINSPTCSGTDKLQWTGTAFLCSSDVDTDTDTTNFNVAAAGTGGSQNISSGGTVTFGNGTGTTATRSGSTVTYGLNNTAVTAGTYAPVDNADGSMDIPQFTVDAQGRLTSATTTSVTLTGIANSQLANSAITINAAGGLSGGSSVSLGGSVNLTLDLSDAGDSTTATTNSGSGLEVSGGEIGLLRGCSSNQLLKWNSSSLRWECASDTDTNSGGTVTSITAGTGLSGGTITTSGTINIANTGVTAATYGSSTSIPVITVNAQGQITAANSTAIPTADTSTTGLLTDTDWDTFNGKENVLTFTGNGLFSRSGNTVTGMSCSTTGDIPKWNGSTFACAADAGGASYTAGDGLDLSGSVFSINSPTCAGTDKLQWDGTDFICSADVDTDTDTTNFNVAAAGTGGSQNISSGGTVTFGNGTGTTATRSGSTVTYGLNNTAVSAGTYAPVDNADGSMDVPQFTVDAQGRLTAASTTTVTLTGIANSQLANSGITINTAGGLSGGTTVSLGGTINLSLDLSDAGDSATATTNSGSGLEVSGGEIGLLRGCSTSQLLKWNSTSLRWECASDTDTNSGGTVTSITAGTGLSGGTITTSGTINIANTGVTAATYGSSTSIPIIAVNAQGQITSASSSAIPIADTSTTGLLTDTDWDTFNGKENILTFNGNGLFSRSGNTVTGLACSTGQIPKWSGGVFACGTDVDTDTDTTYSAGNGLSLGGTTFSINSPTCSGTDKLQWTGTVFVCTADVDTDTGVTSIGTIDSQTKSANGAVISGTTLVLQTADGTNPGLVSTGTQTFAGAKTFSGSVNANGDVTLGDAAADGITITGEIRGASPLAFEGSTNDGVYTTFAITDPTLARTITFPDRSGTVSLSGDTFTGDVTGTLNASGATTLTIAANSVALGTDTTGDYVSNVTAGGGLTGTATGEGSTPTLAIVSSNGGIVVNADDIALTIAASANALSSTTSSGSGLEVLSSGLTLLQGCSNSQLLKWNETTDVWECAADVDTDTGVTSVGTIDSQTKSANGAVISGTVVYLQTADASAPGLVSTGTQTFAGDKTFNGNVITGGNLTANGDVTLGNAATDAITFTGEVRGASPLTFEGSTNDGVYTTFAITDPTLARTITFPDRSGTVSLSGDTFTGDVTGTLNTSGATALTIAANSVALGADTTGNYVADVAAGTGLSVAGTPGEGWTPTVSLANTAVSAGTYAPADNANGSIAVPQFTVDAQGRLTAASTANITPTGIANAQLANSSLTITAGAGLANGGAVSLGGTVALDIGAGNGITVNANDITIDLTSATDALSATTSSSSGLEVLGTGLTLLQGCSNGQLLKWNETTDVWECAADTDTDTGVTSIGTIDSQTKSANGAVISGNTLVLQTADATMPGLVSTGTQTFAGAKTFTGNLTATGTATFQNAIDSGSAFTILDSTGTTQLFNVDTATKAVTLNTDGYFNVFTSTGNSLYLDPVTFTVGGVNGGITYGDTTGTFSAYGLVGSLTFDGTNNVLQSLGTAGGYGLYFDGNTNRLMVGTSPSTTYALNVDGSTNITSGNAYRINGVDINTAGTLSNVAYKNAANTFTLNNTFSTSITTPLVTSSSALAVTGGTTLALSSTGSNAVSLDSGTTGAINIGTSANAKAITIGNATGASATVVNCGTGNCQFAANATDHATTVGSITGTSNTNIRSGTGGITLNAASTTATGHIYIGSSSSSTTPDLLVFGVKSDAGDPAGLAGAMYYNDNAGKFRCYQNGAWADCITTDTGVTSIGALDSLTKSANGAVISGTSLVLQTADASMPGLVSTGTQTFAGDKTFTGLVTANGSFTLETGDTFTMNGDAFTDLTGSGLAISSGALIVDDTSATGFFRNGGNTFGAAGTLGTNDGNALNFETNNTNRFQISSSASTLTGQGNTSINSTGSLTIDAAATSSISIGNNPSNNNTVYIGNASGTSSTNIYSGTGDMWLTSGDNFSINTADDISILADSTVLSSQNDSATAFQVQNSGLEPLFNIDASTASVTVGGSSTDSATAFEVKDSLGTPLLSVDTISKVVGVYADGGFSACTDTGNDCISLTPSSFQSIVDTSVFSHDGATSVFQFYDANTSYNMTFDGVSGALTVGTDGGGSNQSLNVYGTSLVKTQNPSGSTTAFQVQNSSANNILRVSTDSGSEQVNIGSSTVNTDFNVIQGFDVLFGVTPGATGTVYTYPANIDFSCATSATFCNFGSNGTVHTTNVGSLTGSSTTNIRGGTGGITLQASSSTTSGNVQIGLGTGTSNPDILVLDTKNTSGDPTGTNGAMYYNSNTGKFRCYQNSTWANCITVDTGVTTIGTIDSQTKSGNGAVISGTSLVLQTADVSNPGLVSTGTQSFAGNKTFTGNVTTNGTFLNQNSSDSTAAFQINNAAGEQIVNVDTTSDNLITNSSFEANTTGWAGKGGGSITQNTSHQYSGNASAAVSTALTFNRGTSYSYALASSTTYTFSGYVKSNSGSSISLNAGYSEDGSTDTVCASTSTPNNTAWTRFTCTFTTGTTSGSPYVYVTRSTGGFVSGFYLDGVTLKAESAASPFGIGGLSFNGIITSPIALKNQEDSDTAFTIQSSDNSNLISVDTRNKHVNIGGDATSLFVNFDTNNRYVNVVSEGFGGLYVYDNVNGSGINYDASAEIFGANVDSFYVMDTAASIYGITFDGTTGNVGIGLGIGSANYKFDVDGDINISSGSVYRYNGTAGTTTTCSGGQILLNPVLQGGITTAGTCTSGAVTSIGTIDSQTKSANGAVISGNSLVLQTADASFPGLVSTGTQSFAGNKTFTGNVITNGSLQVDGSTVLGDAATDTITANGSMIANATATGTTDTTSGTGTNTTTVTIAGTAFANGDVILIDNVGQDYYTRVTAGGGTSTLTVSPAVTFETGRTVTKYNIQNIGATDSDYTTASDRFFQGYFLGGVVAGAGTTTLSDGRLSSTVGMNFDSPSYTFTNTSDSTDAFRVNKANGESLVKFDTATTENLLSNGNFEANTSGWAAHGSSTVSQTTSQKYLGSGSMSVANTAAANSGAKLNYTLASQTSYTMTFYVKNSLLTTSVSTINIGRSEDGSTDTDCATGQSINGAGWSKITCTFTTGNVTGTDYIYIKQTDAIARTLYVDSVQLQTSTNMATNPDVEVNTTGWSTYGAPTLSQTTSQFYTGAGSLQVDTSASGSSEGPALTPATVQPNTTYTFSAMVMLDAGTVSNKTFSVLKRFDNTDSGAGTSCTSASLTPGTWTRLTCMFTTSSNADTSPFISINVTDDGVTPIAFYVDNASLAVTKWNSNDIGRISLNGSIDSPLTVRGAQDSTSALQVQQQNGKTVFNVDTLNGRVGIGTDTPTKTLQVDGKALIKATSSDTDTFEILGSTTSNNVALRVGANTKAVTVGATANTSNASLTVYGTGLILPKSNTSNAFRVQNAAGTNMLQVDSSSQVVRFGAGVGTFSHDIDGQTTDIWADGGFAISTNSGNQLYFDPTNFSVYGANTSMVLDDAGGTFQVFDGVGQFYMSGGKTSIGVTPSLTYALNVDGDTNLSSGSVYRIGGTAGATTTCSGGQILLNPALLGGLTTSGTCTSGVVTSIGTIDSQTKSANGAVISSNVLVLQTADASMPGLVSTGTQTFAGDKTFNGTITGASSIMAPLFDQSTAAALDIGTTNATSINLNQNTSIASNKTLTANGRVTFKDAANSPNAFQVQNSAGDALFNAGSSALYNPTKDNLIANSNFENGATWQNKNGGSVGGAGTNGAYLGQWWMSNNNTGAGDGASYNVTLSPSTTYTFSAYVRIPTGSMSTLVLGRQDQSGTDIDCATSPSFADTDGWRRVSCTFTTGGTISGSNVYIKQSDAVSRQVHVDAVMLQQDSSLNAYTMGDVFFSAPINRNLIVTGGYNGGKAFQVQTPTGDALFAIDTASNQITADVGMNFYTPSYIFKNTADSGYAFQVQKSNGTNVFNVNTSNDRIEFTGYNTSTGIAQSTVADGASAIGFNFNTTSNYTTAGAKLVSFSNWGVEKAYIDKDGNIDIASGAVYKVNGTPGASTTCSGGQFLQDQVVLGGLTTGGTCVAGGGVTTVGAFSGSSIANGASISGSTITFGPADGTNPGMVTTGTQTLAGAKTFSSAGIFDQGLTVNNSQLKVRNLGGGFLVQDTFNVDLFSVDTSSNKTVTIGSAATHGLTINAEIRGASPLIFEGATNDDVYTTFAVTDPTSARTITFPDRSGTVSLSGDTFTGDVTGTLNSSGATGLTIAADAVALGTDTTGNYVAGNTAGNGIAITGSAGEGWSPTVSISAPTCSGTDKLQWNGTAFICTADTDTGVTTVGAFSGSSIANGASISGTTITFGPADGTNPGMVTTGTQTLAGNKTFTGTTTIGSAANNQLVITPGWSAGDGVWINLTTSGPSGIGTGGPGANPFLAYAAGSGQWFSDALAGDTAYRNTSGRILMGNTGGAAQVIIDTNSTAFNTNIVQTSSITTGTAFQINTSSITTGSAFEITGPSASKLLRVKNDSDQGFNQAQVIIGEGDANNPESLARDSLYVFGRINTSWNQLWADCLTSEGTKSAATTATGVYGAAYSGSATTGRLQQTATSGVSGVCRFSFATPAANATTHFGSGGALTTQRSLNPVFEARVQSDSNTDHRNIVGFSSLTANNAVSADTNNTNEEAFFRKTAAGTQWETVTRSASGTEEVNTNVGATNTWHRLRIEMDDTNAEIRFFVDGTLVATHTTTPTAQIGFSISNSVTSTTSRNLDVDYMRIWSDDPPASVAPNSITQDEGLDTIADAPVPDEPEIEDNSNDALLSRIQTLESNVDELNQYKEVLSIETIGDSSLKKAIILSDAQFKKQVEFLATANFRSDVNVDGTLKTSRLIVTNNTGDITLQPGQTEVQVFFLRPLGSKPNVFLSTENPDVKVVAQQRSATGFTVKLSQPLTEPLEVQWFATEKE